MGWQNAVNWAPSILFLLVFFGAVVLGLFLASYDMHEEQHKRAEEAERRVTNWQYQAQPKVTIEGLVKKPDDFSYYLLVRNTSPVEGVADCLARIEEVADSNGQAILSHIPLRTETQVGGQPEGRFNLDPSQDKRILVCEPAQSSSFSFRILGADGFSKKLQNGRYKMRIRLSTRDGKPQDAIIGIAGSAIEFEGRA
jgi:hypothetical protein